MKPKMDRFEHNRNTLLNELRRLETELHKQETRRSRKRLDALLHPEFVEFGRSGRRYTRAETLNEFGPKSVLSEIRAQSFELAVLTEGSALLTYVSSHVDKDGHQSRRTLRSSVWIRTEVGWQMRFHQGTPASETASLVHTS